MNIRVVRELLARLFVIAFQNRMHPLAFTWCLERSNLIKVIEIGEYDDYFNKSLIYIFSEMTGNKITVDNSFGVFNDAYWCGYMYFELFLRLKKPFSYIFLKLPLPKLIDIYSIYHEMDFSSLLEYFNEQEKKATILRLFCNKKNISLSKLSSATGINMASLSKYNASDEALYKASFQNIVKIAKYFDSPLDLFVEKI